MVAKTIDSLDMATPKDSLVSRLQSCSPTATALLSEHRELCAGAREVAEMLHDSFPGIALRVDVDKDPDDGQERLCFEAFDTNGSHERRVAFYNLVAENLPDSLLPYEDSFVFVYNKR